MLPNIAFHQAIVLGVLGHVDLGYVMVLVDVDVDLRAIWPIEAVVLLTGGSAG